MTVIQAVSEASERNRREWVLLAVVLVAAVSTASVVLLPGDGGARGVDPKADWNWDASDGTVVVTHAGGETLLRSNLFIVVEGVRSDEAVADLSDAGDDRVVRPFPDETVARGDTLRLDADELDGRKIAIRWESDDGTMSATLGESDYPPFRTE